MGWRTDGALLVSDGTNMGSASTATPFACRPGCAACCIVISISSALPGMPSGKPAGVRCANLSPENRCTIYGRSDYPAVCANFKASFATCGNSNEFAMATLDKLERLTSPDVPLPTSLLANDLK